MHNVVFFPISLNPFFDFDFLMKAIPNILFSACSFQLFVFIKFLSLHTSSRYIILVVLSSWVDLFGDDTYAEFTISVLLLTCWAQEFISICETNTVMKMIMATTLMFNRMYINLANILKIEYRHSVFTDV